MSKLKLLSTIALAGVIGLMSTTVYAKERTKGRGAPGAETPVIYVYSQDKYYDTILLGSLPYRGTDNFQLLEMDGPTGVQTEFGPTDTGYYGGRWWVDNGNGYMDEDDTYFLCPLLGPGRDEP